MRTFFGGSATDTAAAILDAPASKLTDDDLERLERIGYLWWLIDDPKGFAARGYLDTRCYVFPGLELVVARMQTQPYLFATEPYEPKVLALLKRIVRK